MTDSHAPIHAWLNPTAAILRLYFCQYLATS